MDLIQCIFKIENLGNILIELREASDELDPTGQMTDYLENMYHGEYESLRRRLAMLALDIEPQASV